MPPMPPDIMAELFNYVTELESALRDIQVLSQSLAFEEETHASELVQKIQKRIDEVMNKPGYFKPCASGGDPQ